MTHLFVHYHLRPGGVTRVLQQQTLEFGKRGIPFVTLSAGPASSMGGDHRIVPDLDYARHHVASVDELKQSIDAVVRNLPRPHIWHIHNPSLGCHPGMSSLVHEWARTNERIIFHIHDFAEDGREKNLQRLRQGPPWFPYGARIHYIVLTMRDREILCNAGLPRENITILGNPITPQPLIASASNHPQLLYPVRAITRKNMGEMLFLASLSPNNATFATTLRPASSRYQEEYRHWQQIAKQLDLPITWAIAENSGLPLEEHICQSTHLLSTSTQEGFGMAFLESIAWQRPLIGRAIPHIQENLAQHGIAHPYLYDSLLIDSLEFSRQSLHTKTELIKRVRSDPSSAVIIQGNNFYEASSWIASALSNDHQPLPLSLVDSFHPQHHAEAVLRIAQQLKDAPASPLHYADADSVHRSFDAIKT